MLRDKSKKNMEDLYTENYKTLSMEVKKRPNK